MKEIVTLSRVSSADAGARAGREGGSTLKAATALMKVCYRQAKRLLARYRREGPKGWLIGTGGSRPANAFGRGDARAGPDASSGALCQVQRYPLRRDAGGAGGSADRPGDGAPLAEGSRNRSQAAAPTAQTPEPASSPPADGAPDAVGRQPPPLVRSPAAALQPRPCHRRCDRNRPGRPVPAPGGRHRLPQAPGHGLRRHGIPAAVYQDRHSALYRNDDHWSHEEELAGVRFPTHVGRVLEELGVQIIPAFSAQAKGRIERQGGTFQDRLIAEMALEGITEIDPANEWLDKTFLDRFNGRFAKRPELPGSAFRKISAAERYLLICFAYEATVANDNTVCLGGLVIDIPRRPSQLRPPPRPCSPTPRRSLDGLVRGQPHRPSRPYAPERTHRSWRPRQLGETNPTPVTSSSSTSKPHLPPIPGDIFARS